MADPIEAHYTPDGDDWQVAVKGRGRTLTGRAPGLIAARDKADQLVEQLTTDESGRKTVVHLLNGDAVEFTTAYLTARLARTEDPAPEPPPSENPPGNQENKAAGAEKNKAADAQKANVADAQKNKTADAQKAKNVPAPSPPAAPEQPPKIKPTPAPRTESQAAHPAAKPPEATPAEETAPSGS